MPSRHLTAAVAAKGGDMGRRVLVIGMICAASALALPALGAAASPFTQVSFTSLSFAFVKPAGPLCAAGFNVKTTLDVTPTGRQTEATNILGQPTPVTWEVAKGTQTFTCPDGSTFTLAFTTYGYTYCYSLGCIQKILNLEGHWHVAGGTGTYAQLVGSGTIVINNIPGSGSVFSYKGQVALL
jgi:hypothetical protein